MLLIVLCKVHNVMGSYAMLGNPAFYRVSGEKECTKVGSLFFLLRVKIHKKWSLLSSLLIMTGNETRCKIKNSYARSVSLK